ncbi:MAG: hypothetical protein GXY52_02530 [Chloroflexi bacterium]|nr:hypothetical protein [Chloroflexota bacterium]
MLKFISVFWIDAVSEAEYTAATQAMEQMIMHLTLRTPSALEHPPLRLRLYGNWFIPALMPHAPYWGIQWYVDQTYQAELDRVIAPDLLELIRKEPWQEASPHYDLVMIDLPLTDMPAPLARLRSDYATLSNSLHGLAAVISVNEVRKLHSLEQEAGIRRLARHALGHMLGAIDLARQEQVERRGTEMHCTNRCVMRHAADAAELAELAQDEAALEWDFCPLCTRSLDSLFKHEIFSSN